MKFNLKKNHIAQVVAIALCGTFAVSVQAATSHIGSGSGIEASVLDSGNFDTSAGEGALGLSYTGLEWVNWGTHSSWMWLNSSLTGAVNTLGSNPLSSVNVASDGTTFVLTGNFGSGSLLYTQTMTLINNETIGVQVSLSNNSSTAVTGVEWGVGLDPDIDLNFGGSFATTNTILGSGNGAAVSAHSLMHPGYSLTLANTTGAGAFDVVAFINSGDCCSPVDPSVALFAAQATGFSTVADDSISLAYHIGTIGAWDTETISYQYIMAVPEPETYAMLLAGLGLLGFSVRRRKSA